jgi:predicted amidohydrolase YtcJ
VTDALVLRRVELDGRHVDVHVEGGVVAAVGPALTVPVGTAELDGEGGALLPGLHDHHVHLLAMAARTAGLDLDPSPDMGSVDDAIRTEAAGRGRGDWVRASGYDEHRHGAMDRYRLDSLAPGVAVRVQHRTGLSWVLSTEALSRLGLLGDGASRPDGVDTDAAGAPTGWLHRLDGWLGERVPRSPGGLAAVGRTFASYGITGVTDATFALGAERSALLRAARESGDLPQGVVLLGADVGDPIESWTVRGPAKLLADEALGLDPAALAEQIARHHAEGRAVAVHAVTRAENVAAVTALAQAGPFPGDRIEHGSVLPADLDPLLVAGGVTVIVQPSLVAERGDHHLLEVEPDDLPFLHRHRSLLAAGVRVGVGSDAPVTSADPWAGIAAASRRTTRSGALVGPDEAVDPSVALDWYLADPLDPGGPPRRVAPGGPADLCLLQGSKAEALADLDAGRVRATLVAGRLVHP